MALQEVKRRSVEEIRGEYSNGCAKAGHIQFQIFTLQKDLDALNGVLRDLNLEAAASAQAEQKAAESSEAAGV